VPENGGSHRPTACCGCLEILRRGGVHVAGARNAVSAHAYTDVGHGH
jgi:hypothetical protein